MANHEPNERELDGLLAEIRAQGTPYSEEPDERYFTNFRVRIMQRIEEEAERKNAVWYLTAWEWLSGSKLRAGAMGSALAAAVIAGMLLMPGDEPAEVADATRSSGPTAIIDSSNESTSRIEVSDPNAGGSIVGTLPGSNAEETPSNEPRANAPQRSEAQYAQSASHSTEVQPSLPNASEPSALSLKVEPQLAALETAEPSVYDLDEQQLEALLAELKAN